MNEEAKKELTRAGIDMDDAMNKSCVLYKAQKELLARGYAIARMDDLYIEFIKGKAIIHMDYDNDGAVYESYVREDGLFRPDKETVERVAEQLADAFISAHEAGAQIAFDLSKRTLVLAPGNLEQTNYVTFGVLAKSYVPIDGEKQREVTAELDAGDMLIIGDNTNFNVGVRK